MSQYDMQLWKNKVRASPYGPVNEGRLNYMEQGIFDASVVYNVKAKKYGAKGDGQTDDTAAINACIEDAIGALTRWPYVGGIVFFPAGRYIITDKLEVGSGWVTLKGIKQEISVIQLEDAVDIKAIFNADEAAGGSIQNILFEDLTFDGNYASNIGEDPFGNNCGFWGDFSKCRFNRVSAVRFNGSAGKIGGGIVYIDKCDFDSKSIGLQFVGTDSWILNSMADGLQRSAAFEGGPLRVIGNHFHGGPDYNVFMYPGSWIDFSHNILEAATVAALRMELPDYYSDKSNMWGITGNFFTQLDDNCEAIQLIGYDADTRIGDIVVAHNRFLKAGGKTPGYMLHLKHADNIVVNANIWKGQTGEATPIFKDTDVTNIIIAANDDDTFT